MFHLILFVSVLSFSVCLSTPKCLERRSFGFLDCSGLMLNDTVQLLTVRDSWVKHLDLRMNRFVSINFTKLILAYPDLQFVDVRDNVAFDCRISRGLKIFIRSNCNSRSAIYLPRLASSIILAKTQFLLPPISTTPFLLPSPATRTTFGMPFSSTTSTTPSLLPPTSIRTTHEMFFLTTPSLLSPTSIRTTHEMFFLTTPSLLPPTSIRTTHTHGMFFSSTVSAMRFSQFYFSSIQNRTTAFTYAGKSLKLSTFIICYHWALNRTHYYPSRFIYLHPQDDSVSTEKG